MTKSLQLQFLGQNVTAERDKHSATGWTVTGWEQGLPVCRRPITAETLADLKRRYDYVVTRS